jgi:hypothetical protein
LVLLVWAMAPAAQAQFQVELKLPRLQFIAYEPIVATVAITNLAGRDVDFRDQGSQPWFGFEVTGQDGQIIGALEAGRSEEPLRIESGKRVTQKINLTPRYPVQDFGTYHVRAHVYFSDLDKFFYSQAKVFEVTDARPIWERTVGVPEGAGAGNSRTYSLMSNRFPNHTSLYVRVADRDRGVVYATYPLGHVISFDEPHADIDRNNQLHVLHCGAPRTWTYSRISVNGELVSRATFFESKTRPRLVHSSDGQVLVHGGLLEQPATAAAVPAPKLSDRPSESDND